MLKDTCLLFAYANFALFAVSALPNHQKADDKVNCDLFMWLCSSPGRATVS